MKLSQAAELAGRGIQVLAQRYGDSPVPLDVICQVRDLPKQYMVKLFGMLARAGLVMPIRGKGGGYLLGRAPEDISLLEVIEAVEGPLAVNQCQDTPPRCDFEECPVRPVWTDIQRYMREKLGSVTLADAAKCDFSANIPQPDRPLAGMTHISPPQNSPGRPQPGGKGDTFPPDPASQAAL
jgi:Rrf2 family protein